MSDFSTYNAQNQRTNEDKSIIVIEIKICALINDWEYDNAYGKNPSKTRPWLLASAIRFVLETGK